jgi:sialidase-1
LTASIPFTSGTGGYHTYRIPALLNTGGGVLLAFAEGRVNGLGDWGNIDIVLRRSIDGGTTWGPQQVVTSHGTDTAGNPVPMVDAASGDVVLVSCRNGGSDTIHDIVTGQAPPRRVYVQRSADDGATWTAPAEITAQVRTSWMRWYATGPCHGVTMTTGPHAGRLVVPCCHTRTPLGDDTGEESKYSGGHAIFSDDGGLTWQIGFTSSNTNGTIDENEATAAELPDGRLYFNCRCNESDASAGNRADAVSLDGGQTVTLTYRPQAALITPVVQGSVLTLPDGRLVYSGPSHPEDRAAMALWISADGGATWDPRRRVSGLPAAYSDLTLVDEQTLGLLYETGDWSPYKRIEFVRIPLTGL